MRNVMLEFADDQGLLRVDGSASVHELMLYSNDIYQMGRRHAIDDLFEGKGVPASWAEDEEMEQEFWDRMEALVKERKERIEG